MKDYLKYSKYIMMMRKAEEMLHEVYVYSCTVTEKHMIFENILVEMHGWLVRGNIRLV